MATGTPVGWSSTWTPSGSRAETAMAVGAKVVRYDDLKEFRLARSSGDRVQGRPTLVLELTNGSELKLASVAQPGIVAELADRLHGLTGRWDTPERVALVVPIRPGSQAQAEALLAAGPPFDPSEFDLVSHAVFVTESEVVFLFEGSAGAFSRAPRRSASGLGSR